MQTDNPAPSATEPACVLDRPVGRLAPERANSAEWFHARSEEVRREIATWPAWMRDGLDIASARWPV